jgi:hypothetical protein
MTAPVLRNNKCDAGMQSFIRDRSLPSTEYTYRRYTSLPAGGYSKGNFRSILAWTRVSSTSVSSKFMNSRAAEESFNIEVYFEVAFRYVDLRTRELFWVRTRAPQPPNIANVTKSPFWGLHNPRGDLATSKGIYL